LGVGFGNFDCIVFGLGELCFAFVTVLYLDLGAVFCTLGFVFGDFVCGIFGLQGKLCFVLLTVLYLDFGSWVW
jgi:hypothetical protein